MDSDPVDHLGLTVKIVSAFVSRNQASRSDLVDLVQNVGRTLQALSAGGEKPKPKLVPAVPISKSVTPDFIISLEDGRRMKSLKRYLASMGMTPADYRRKWGLPPDYPLVAPNFTELRSQAAKRIRLGQRNASDQTSAT
ncbi:MucR family transcriptional regulator [Mesorhizobium qingshengii]|uniref:Transcriptional regulator, MucR family n=1 Tax=Mesorhizobium qingshengii TaxID=1165689 RepID=A0A1G5ZB02_9HYPH|nr:MucR family transcriptional regulator [Mesorhizobium qingshengii]SDA91974.1 transcriptional regulator, MucR family [Mesorhizobium qingshengii]